MKMTAKIGGGTSVRPHIIQERRSGTVDSSISPKGGLRRKGGEPHG